jgi:hypothetical protein
MTFDCYNVTLFAVLGNEIRGLSPGNAADEISLLIGAVALVSAETAVTRECKCRN